MNKIFRVTTIKECIVEIDESITTEEFREWFRNITSLPGNEDTVRKLIAEHVAHNTNLFSSSDIEGLGYIQKDGHWSDEAKMFPEVTARINVTEWEDNGEKYGEYSCEEVDVEELTESQKNRLSKSWGF